MAWNPSSIAGLTPIDNGQEYDYRETEVALAGTGGLSDGAVSASFAYDDTAFGGVPAGVFKTLATCAVNPFDQDGTIPSGEYVQLQLTILRALGRDYRTPSSASNYGQITAFTASMRGVGPVRLANRFDGTDLALPWDTSVNVPPAPYLMRPTPLTWTGQDDNDAIPTIWLQRELDVVSFAFTAHSQSADVLVSFSVVGWQ
jgi:hypothetical protein